MLLTGVLIFAGLLATLVTHTPAFFVIAIILGASVVFTDPPGTSNAHRNRTRPRPRPRDARDGG